MTSGLSRTELAELTDGEREALQRVLFLVESMLSLTQTAGEPPMDADFYCGP